MSSTQDKYTGAVVATGAGVNVTATNGTLAIGGATATNGSANFTVVNGDMTVTGNLTANQGDIKLQSNDVAGKITFSNATVSATSTLQANGGRVVVSTNGAPTPPLTQGTAPGGLTVTTSNAGHIFFNDNSIALAGSNNSVSANGGVVILDGAAAGAISVQGDVLISATGQAPKLNNLDLTNNVGVTGNIVSLQNQGWLLGTLTVDGSGTATAGNVVLAPINIAAGGVTSIDIPVNVTLTGENFGAANAINVTSGVADVIIGGTVEFTTAGSFGVISTTQMVQLSGLLVSAGSLTLNTLGLNNSGNLTASTGSINVNSTGALSIAGTGNISAAGGTVGLSAAIGAISVSGTQTVSGNLALSAASASGAVNVAAGAGFSVSGNLSANTRSILNDGGLTAANISASSPAGLAIAGSGAWTATAAGGNVSLSALSGNLNFNVDQTFNTGAAGSGSLLLSSPVVPSARWAGWTLSRQVRSESIPRCWTTRAPLLHKMVP